jgi:RNA polymerase sigma factor (sigma-70 family)
LPSDRECDPDLCRRAAAGDRAAFSILVGRHESRLRGFLGHLAGPDLGDELAQQSFVKAWESARHFRGDSQYSSWLCAIGWRCFVDHVRTERSEARRRAESAVEHPAEPIGSDTGLDSGLDLARALAMLDPAERAALVLCEGHGWSHVEAAGILRIPLGTLKTLVARAKRKCREMLIGTPS